MFYDNYCVCRYFSLDLDLRAMELYLDLPKKDQTWTWQLLEDSDLALAGLGRLDEQRELSTWQGTEYPNPSLHHLILCLKPAND